MELNVQEFIGINCITLDDGMKIYNRIDPELAKGSMVTLNFTGVKVFASPFFNSAIGPLLKNYTADQLNERLIFKSLAGIGQSVLKRVVENSSRYFTDPDFQKSLDSILKTKSDNR